MNTALREELAPISTHDLVELVGHRMEVPTEGTATVRLTFNDGEWVNSNYDGKVKPFPQGCTCRRHSWSPICPVHPPTAAASFGATR
jgi:hypothetical protein